MLVVSRNEEDTVIGVATSTVRWGSHLCHLYREPRDLVEVVVPYLAAGLESGERCIWVASPDLRAEGARAALAGAVPDLGERESRGQLVIVDHRARQRAHGEVVAEWLVPERAALSDGYRGLRIANSAAAKSSCEPAGAALAGHQIVGLCSYRLDQLAPDQLGAVLCDHQGAVLRRAGRWDYVASPTAAHALAEGVRPCAHSVEFFDQRAYPSATIAERLGAALEHGDGVLVLATASHVAALREDLARYGDLPALAARRRVAFVDAEALYAALGGTLDAARIDEKVGSVAREIVERCGRLCAYGELVDVACRHGNYEGAIALERWWNAQLTVLPVELDCGYSVQSFERASTLQAFRAICDQHTAIRSDSPLTADPRRLVAELRQVEVIADSEAQHLAALQHITAVLADALTLEQIGDVAVGEIAATLGATRIALELCGKLVVLRGVTTPDDGDAVAASLHVVPVQVGVRDDMPPELHWFGGVTQVVAPLVLHGVRSGTLLLGFEHWPIGAVQRALVDDVVRQLAPTIERARAITEVHDLRHRAESASAAKDRFLAMLGHELRNPLSPILMATQLMRVRAPDVLAKERVTIELGVSQMIRLVDDLLEVTRITRGKLELARTPVELSLVVAQALERAGLAIEGRTHNIRTTIPSGLVIDVDVARLAQAISNVLINAAKYLRPGGVIAVDACLRGEMVVLAVTDDGVGIPADLLPHIFDLFVQGNQSIDRLQGGLGVGLAIARSIIELHGGTITAVSEGVDRGSAFTIALPHYGPPAAERGLCVSQQRHRILIVDDNTDAAWLLAEALRLLGHDVRVSHDGESALELARAWPPEVAFCDLGLPGMDGYALAGALQQLPARPRLVAITGYDQTSARERSRAAGFELHLIKPVNLHEIQMALESTTTR